jgi:hypothetical protein
LRFSRVKFLSEVGLSPIALFNLNLNGETIMSTYYKINTGTTKETDLSSLISRLDYNGTVGIPKDKQQFHVIRHQLAHINTIVELSYYNLRNGFTKELFDAILYACYSRCAFKDGYVESHDRSKYFDTWLEKGIIAEVK